jgi:hypothetical protein
VATEPIPEDFDEATAWTMVQELRADIAATRTTRQALEAEKAEALEQLEAARAPAQPAPSEADQIAAMRSEIDRLRIQLVAAATIEQPVAQEEHSVPAEPPAPRLMPAWTPGHGASFEYVPDIDAIVKQARSASQTRY